MPEGSQRLPDGVWVLKGRGRTLDLAIKDATNYMLDYHIIRFEYAGYGMYEVEVYAWNPSSVPKGVGDYDST